VQKAQKKAMKRRRPKASSHSMEPAGPHVKLLLLNLLLLNPGSLGDITCEIRELGAVPPNHRMNPTAASAKVSGRVLGPLARPITRLKSAVGPASNGGGRC